MSINLTNLSSDLNIIQSLQDTPTESASELKAKFDEAGNTIKTFINETLIDELETAFNSIKAEAILSAHPIGSYYWSTSSTSPATLFGGTWEQVKDKFILSAGDVYTAGNTGGNATHTHDVPGVKHKHSLSSGYAMIGRDTSSYMDIVWKNASKSFTGDLKMATNKSVTGGSISAINAVALSGDTGETTPSNTTSGSASSLPPYEVAYCWKRTA